MIDILRWVLIILSIPVLVILVIHTVRHARLLAKRIDDYHEQQEASRSQPGPVDPYADMAAAFGEDERRENVKNQDDGNRAE